MKSNLESDNKEKVRTQKRLQELESHCVEIKNYICFVERELKPLRDKIEDIEGVFKDFQRDFEQRVRRAEIHVHKLRKETEPLRFTVPALKETFNRVERTVTSIQRDLEENVGRVGNHDNQEGKDKDPNTNPDQAKPNVDVDLSL